MQPTTKFKKLMFTKHTKITCQYCDANLNETIATVDHFYPKLRGGSNTFDNFRISCLPCNMKKNNEFQTFDPGCLMSFKDIQIYRMVGFDILKVMYEKNLI